ncbi:AAA family ATPase, partial [Candidatus Uhrbacteria bacterium]|nr:AAA family ATPase [Candidatus Uhrbacteria bacterium]
MSDTTAVAVPSPPTRTPIDKLLQIREELVGYSFERETVVDGVLTGLVAGHHALLIGPPGTDKSRLIRALCHRITDARYFGRLLTKFTHPDELFGPLDVMELERGHYRRVTMGRLPEAEIAFLDEVFKSGSAILNTLLELMNERMFNDGSERKAVPLRMLIGASNELPNPEDGLEAFADRFPLRFRVQYLQQ